eukprot:1484990-Pleurochrysis_carterae.AAC.1
MNRVPRAGYLVKRRRKVPRNGRCDWHARQPHRGLSRGRQQQRIPVHTPLHTHKRTRASACTRFNTYAHKETPSPPANTTGCTEGTSARAGKHTNRHAVPRACRRLTAHQKAFP